MPLEVFTFISSLVRTNPTGTDGVNQGDDHIRGVKQAIQDSFPNIDAAVTATPAQLNDIAPASDFVGMVAAFAEAASSSNWLLCDGSAVSRTGINIPLFASLGTAYGVGDGSTTFNLPDYRGEFLRGQDIGAGNDPDAAARTDRGDGTTGDNVGTRQAGEVNSHQHDVQATGRTFSTFSGTNSFEFENPLGNNGTLVSDFVNAAGGNETRPRNVNVRYYIHI